MKKYEKIDTYDSKTIEEPEYVNITSIPTNLFNQYQTINREIFTIENINEFL